MIHLRNNKLVQWLFLIGGTMIIAFAYATFLFPNQILSGGVSGISTLVNALTGINPSIIMYVINIPLLALSYFAIGRDSFVKTVAGSLLFPFFVGFFEDMPAMTNDPFLVSVIGGFLMGIGVGCTFIAEASTGGTATIVQVLNKYTPLSHGRATILVDGLIVLSAFFIFDINAVMYSLIAIFTMSKAIDITQIGRQKDLNAMIISNQYAEIKAEIAMQLNRSVTVIKAEGGYSGREINMLSVVVNQMEYGELMSIINSHDDAAFVIVNQVQEVQGRGFSLEKDYLSTL